MCPVIHFSYTGSLKSVTFATYLLLVNENPKSALSDLHTFIQYLGLKVSSHKEVHKDMVATIGEGALYC